MGKKKIQVEIVSPERIVFQGEADAVSAPASEGEITILPNHIPLLTKINPGEIKIRSGGEDFFLAVNQGFLTINPDNKVTILTDYAIRSDEIELAKAQEAKERAEKAMAEKTSQRDFVIAEADLRKALLELKVAKRKKAPKIRPPQPPEAE